MAQIVGDIPQTARVEKAGRRPRGAHRGARRHACAQTSPAQAAVPANQVKIEAEMTMSHLPTKLLGAVVFCILLTLTPLDAAVRPPRLEYELMTLPNGLTIVLSPDHSTPIVHVEVWYHVGSKDEKPGRTGFAHLFEHMMFKGSKNVDPEEHASMLASIGGQSNAYTNDDATVFCQTVRPQVLPLVRWHEAERRATLRIDKSTFENEREVVKEERRLRVDNPPFGRLSEILYDQFYTVSPYKHTTIGSMKDLDAASVEDVRDFHNTYYVPANATIAIVGDFDMAQAKELVTRYFGRIPKSARAIPREYP